MPSQQWEEDYPLGFGDVSIGLALMLSLGGDLHISPFFPSFCSTRGKRTCMFLRTGVEEL